MPKKRSLDLQMFAAGPDDDLEGVIDDDDPTEVEPDEDEEEGEEAEGDGEFEDSEFDQLAADDEAEDDGDEEGDETTPAPKPKDKLAATEPAADDGQVFTKAERDAAIEAAISDRFLRDPYRLAMKDLERMTGLPPERIVELHRKQQEDSEAERYAEEHGLTDDEARDYVRRERENKELKDRLYGIELEKQYSGEKARFMSNPHVKKYIAEIDAFSGNGRYLTFELAMDQILGKRFRSGEISGAIESGAVKKTLADIKKQERVRVQKGTVGGKRGATEGMDPFQKSIAAQLGISAKEVAAEKVLIERERRGGK